MSAVVVDTLFLFDFISFNQNATTVLLYTVSQKNIPNIFRKHCRIFIMFGTHVTKKVSNQ